MKAWKFEKKKKNSKFIVRLTRERKKGRKKRFCKEIAKKLLGKKPKKPKILKFYRSRWTPSRFRAVWAITSHTLGEIAKKLKKVAPSISKSQNSQKSWNFLARDERPRNSLRFEPPQAILWVKKKFWIFFAWFGYFWIFLNFQVPIRNPIFWLHGVDALLFPTVLSQ